MTHSMVYLPDEIHHGLKHLAVEQGTSLAQWVREAVEMLYREDMEDLRIARKRLQNFRRHPERVIPFAAYRAKRAKH